MKTETSKATDITNKPAVEADSQNGEFIDEKLIAASTGNLDDIEALCIQPGVTAPAAQQVILTMRVGKPPKQTFFRARAESDFQKQVYILRDEAGLDENLHRRSRPRSHTR